MDNSKSANYTLPLKGLSARPWNIQTIHDALKKCRGGRQVTRNLYMQARQWMTALYECFEEELDKIPITSLSPDDRKGLLRDVNNYNQRLFKWLGDGKGEEVLEDGEHESLILEYTTLVKRLRYLQQSTETGQSQQAETPSEIEIEKISGVIKRLKTLKGAKEEYDDYREGHDKSHLGLSPNSTQKALWSEAQQLIDEIELDLVELWECIVDCTIPEDNFGGWVVPAGTFRQNVSRDIMYALNSKEADLMHPLIQQFKKIRRRLEIRSEQQQDETPKKAAGTEHLDDIFPKKIFPMYPFKSGLMAADDCLYFTTDHTNLEISQKAGGGVRIPLTKEQLVIIDKTVRTRNLSDIKCFLIQKCNVQNVADLSWTDILAHLKYHQGKPDTLDDKQEVQGIHAEEPAIDGQEWSNPMTKSALMQKVGIDGYKKFNTFAKQYGLRQAGNRQLWQICLDRMDRNTKQKFEKT